MRTQRFILAALVCVFGFALADAGVTPVKEAQLPRRFTGTYQWRGGVADKVTLFVQSVQNDKEGLITFTGVNLVHRTNDRFKCLGTINVKTGAITITESDPSDPATAIIDGAYEGTISKDLRSISAVWTTASDGKKGDLRLDADR